MIVSDNKHDEHVSLCPVNVCHHVVHNREEKYMDAVFTATELVVE